MRKQQQQQQNNHKYSSSPIVIESHGVKEKKTNEIYLNKASLSGFIGGVNNEVTNITSACDRAQGTQVPVIFVYET